MLRMHRDGLIRLPARRRHGNGTLHRRRTAQAEPQLPIVARVDKLPELQVRPLADRREAHGDRERSFQWNEPVSKLIGKRRLLTVLIFTVSLMNCVGST